jgi:hypothetical protein
MKVGSRRTRAARLSFTLACTALLAACGCRHTSPPGTPVISFHESSGSNVDFASYRVSIDSITLTDTNNNVITPLLSVESVDLVALNGHAELLEAPAVPSGTYKSASVTFDYSVASVWANLNGGAVGAVPLNTKGLGLGAVTVGVTFDPQHQLVVTNNQSVRLAIDFDLAASTSIDASSSPPKVTVRPFVVVSPAPLDATVMRARGLLVTVPSGTSTFVMNMRPLQDLVSALGALHVEVDANTYYNINGVSYSGSAGLSVVNGLTENTIMVAYGTLTDLSGITPSLHATSVYGGASVESPLQDELTGIVGKRSGDTLTIHGANLRSRLGGNSYANNATATLGSNTIVSQDGVNASGLGLQSISVGQQVIISGQGAVDTAGAITMDATAGQVRLASTRLWGTLTSATPSTATFDVLTLGNFPPSGFTFTGTGAGGQDANPAAYQLDTGTIDLSGMATTPAPLLQVDGFVTPFGTAPPDFNATAAVTGAATEQQLVVEWVNGGATAPFTTVGTGGLVVDLANASLGTVHAIRTGPVSLDLKDLPASPLITTVGADQSKLVLAVGNNVISSGVSVFNSIGSFASALSTTFNGTNKIFRLVAVGQYNAAANTFVATRISVALQE